MSKKTLLNVASFGLAGSVLKDEKKKSKSSAPSTPASSSAASTTEAEVTGRKALIASATAQGDLGNALLGSNRLLGN